MNNKDTTTTTATATTGSGTGRQFKVRPAQHLLTTSGNVVSSNDDDQPILMEARLTETITSLCQLIRSNEQLEDALREDLQNFQNDSGGGNGGNGGNGENENVASVASISYDQDLMEALRENETVILRKRDEARSLAERLRRAGMAISLEDKIPYYSGSELLREMERRKERMKEEGGSSGETKEEGVYL